MICKVHVKANDKAVQCSLCELWIHVGCSDTLDDETYKLIIIMAEKHASHCWSCQCCRSAVLNLNKKVIAIEKRMNQLETDVGNNTEEIGAVKETCKELSKELEVVKQTKNRETTPGTDNEAVFKEFEERESKKENLIIHNLPEPEPTITRAGDRKDRDNEELVKVLQSINCSTRIAEDVKYTVRLGERKDNVNYQDKPRPMIVGFRNVQLRDEILRSARNLVKTRYKDVSIGPDLTNKQRQNEAKMRTDAEKLNREMDSADSLNWEWKVIGPKGQRKLIKTRKTTMDRRKRPRSNEGSPQAGPSSKR